MAEVKFDEAVARFKRNEDRLNTFLNGDDTSYYITDDGVQVPSIRKFLKEVANG